MTCSKVSSVGSDDCDAMALMGANNVLSTARPRKRNFPHTCCTNFLPFASSFGEFECSFAYWCFAPYTTGVCGNGWFCRFRSLWWN